MKMSVQEFGQEECSDCGGYNCEKFYCEDCVKKQLKEKNEEIKQLKEKIGKLNTTLKNVLKSGNK